MAISEVDSIAFGESRQHILSSSAYNPNEVFCFDRHQNIADYRISMIIDAQVNHRHNINQHIRRILESGFITKWHSDHRRNHVDRTIDFGSSSIHIEQLHAPIVFILFCGWILSILTFISEIITERKLRDGNSSRIWIYFEQFFDGKRHYFTNLPERLSKSRK